MGKGDRESHSLRGYQRALDTCGAACGRDQVLACRHAEISSKGERRPSRYLEIGVYGTFASIESQLVNLVGMAERVELALVKAPYTRSRYLSSMELWEGMLN
jgi:hypothetical protein